MFEFTGGRQLHRSYVDKKLGGVAAGLAEYLDVDPTFVRLAWIIATPMTGGLALLAYVAMWAMVPVGDAAGPAEAYQHYGHGRGARSAGMFLVALGLLFLLVQSGVFHWIHWGFIWPVALILAGAAFLMRREVY